MRTRRNSDNGFTLVELVTTIVIVGILAAVVAPRFFDRKVYDVRAYLDQTRAQLRYAQKLAIAQNRPVYVSVSGNRVALCFKAVCSGSTAPADMVLAPTGANSGSAQTVAACIGSAGYDSRWYCEAAPTGVTLTAPPAVPSFYFDAAGKPFAFNDPVTTTVSNFTGATLFISGDGSNQTLTIEGKTGYVH